MGLGEGLSLLINGAVGAYLAWYWPSQVRQKLPRLPRLFVLLYKVLPPFGYALITGSLLYALLRLAGVIDAQSI